MKPLFLTLGVGLALVLGSPSVRADSPPSESPYPHELLAILNETNSADTFVVTLSLLLDAEVEPRTLIPVVIRKAESLGIFADAVKTGKAENTEAFKMVMEAVHKLHQRLSAPGIARGKEIRKETSSARVVPVQPWIPSGREEKYCHKNDVRTPVLPPIREGDPAPLCKSPPDEAEVLRALPHLAHGVPCCCEAFRDNIQVVTELVVDKIDPPRFFPMVGPAQLHHCHWKCTVHFAEVCESACPFPFSCKRPRVEVVYIDKDHLHLFRCPEPEAQRPSKRHLTGY